jgi:hypothetical protein
MVKYYGECRSSPDIENRDTPLETSGEPKAARRSPKGQKAMIIYDALKKYLGYEYSTWLRITPVRTTCTS